MKTDEELQNEIENWLGKVYGVDTGAEAEADLDQEDDTDIPISTVIHDDLGISIADSFSDTANSQKCSK